MRRAQLFGLAVAAALLTWTGANSALAVAVGDPGDLHPASVIIDFESFADGTPETISVGGVHISTFNREGNNDPRIVQSPPPHLGQHPGIFEGQFFGAGRHDFLIEFDNPVAQFGMGIFDPNFENNLLIAYDSGGNPLETAISADGDPIFPTFPTGGEFSTFVGFVRPTADIARVELYNSNNPSDGKTDLLAIDNVMYFSGLGGGGVPEPGSMAIAAIAGLTLIGVAIRRRNK